MTMMEFKDEHHGILVSYREDKGLVVELGPQGTQVSYREDKGLVVEFGTDGTDKRRVHIWVHQRRKKAAIVELYEADGKEKNPSRVGRAGQGVAVTAVTRFSYRARCRCNHVPGAAFLPCGLAFGLPDTSAGCSDNQVISLNVRYGGKRQVQISAIRERNVKMIPELRCRTLYLRQIHPDGKPVD